MPKRPVQHVLEDRSRAAFAAALPPEWILRHQTHDYGIDAEVEFVEEGVVTGRIFKVQLKATAKEGSAARLVRLPRDRREYFAGFGVPVLLVLYQATQDRLFVRWFESFDEEYDNLNSQSMVFRFRVADEWTAETSDRRAVTRESIRHFRTCAMHCHCPWQLLRSQTTLQASRPTRLRSPSKVRADVSPPRCSG